MNYIYDIYLNFKNIPYDFFEWNKKDKLLHLKKIPIIKINKNLFNLVCSNKIKIDKKMLKQIQYKTEIWNKKENIKYSILFCSNSSIIAIKFNNKGISTQKSFLFLDEELEILDSISNLKEKEINIEILKREIYILKTRIQLEKEVFIKKEVLNISNKKLKYLYFECFNCTKTKNKMINDIIKANYKNTKKIYNILKLISTNKN